ncbi:hypothetical protein GCM10010329_40620 [Streptomyces spiroverticillatus]|uniref:Uncharacterized protein n=1 Tax=Streptomyces finlayi TaxID=67296 RepID=A0A918WZU5_9ACTN|nr:hypothetical protein [Streptomyces finlayi]GHA13660.1 hypothetical protein GCM10010329_40620 [Streptomyces spiroverticillatus]GHC97824.1 hypothetical protein GCM10010334_39620 [Streptomyces finlayi]
MKTFRITRLPHPVRALRTLRPRHRAAVALTAVAVLGTSGWVAYDRLAASLHFTECFGGFDPDDPRQVAFAADDVFEGRVLDHDGPENLDDMPVDTYDVEVGARHKGELRGPITVIHPRNGSERLKPGSSYLFATSPWTEEDGTYDGAGHGIVSGTHPARVPAPDGRGAVAARWRWAVAHPVDPASVQRPTTFTAVADPAGR